jgi:CRP/FNR family transcriptional regulator
MPVARSLSLASPRGTRKGSLALIPSDDFKRVSSALPMLAIVENELGNDFARRATLARIPAGRDVMAEGDRAEAVPLLISGQIRVFWIGESGREITLYRFGQGECCVLTADSILGNRLFPACAQVEQDAEVALIPASVFDSWLAQSPAWRQFIFDAMSRRLLSLMDTLDDVAFRRMDTRVAQLLLERSQRGDSRVRMTHQEMADELGSSREVVSRILEDLQARGQIRLSRGLVEIIEPALLKSSSLFVT